MIIQKSYNLQSLNTFHIPAKAAYFTEVKSIDDLIEALQFAQKKKAPIMVLGGGSNVLFTRDFEGLVIANRIMGFESIMEDPEYVHIRVGAGEDWHQTVVRCVEAGLGGIENLSLIPGTVGAAPMQNIGAYGVELKEVFHSLEAFEINTGLLKTFYLNDCEFGYRTSVFKNKLKGKYIIVNVTLRLTKNSVLNVSYGALKMAIEGMDEKSLSIRAISEAVMKVRRSKLPDPNELGNAGSFFKNPTIDENLFRTLKSSFPELPGYHDGSGKTKLSAAWLIESCGWKGKRHKDAGVHDKHSLILVNHGNATGKEIWELAQQIQQSVREKFGIELEAEVNVI